MGGKDTKSSLFLNCIGFESKRGGSVVAKATVTVSGKNLTGPSIKHLNAEGDQTRKFQSRDDLKKKFDCWGWHNLGLIKKPRVSHEDESSSDIGTLKIEI